MEEMLKYLKALTLFQLQNSNGDDAPAPLKTEILLSRAGFKNKEIAELLGKTENAVALTIHRAKKTSSK